MLFEGVIYTFNTKTLDNSNVLAKNYGVPILNFNVIYKLVSSLVDKLSDKLPEIETDEVVGGFLCNICNICKINNIEFDDKKSTLMLQFEINNKLKVTN